MVKALKSLLANIDLLSALYPENRHVLTVLKTLLEFDPKHPAVGEFETLFAKSYLEPLKVQASLQGIWGLMAQDPTVTQGDPATDSPGFEIFADEVDFWISDGQHSYLLKDIDSLHPCLEFTTYQGPDGNSQQFFYLVSGTYLAGMPMTGKSRKPEDYFNAVIKNAQKKLLAVPLNLQSIRLGKEALGVAA